MAKENSRSYVTWSIFTIAIYYKINWATTYVQWIKDDVLIELCFKELS